MNYFLDFWIWASPSIQSLQDTAIHCPVKNRSQRTKINTGKSVCQCLTRERRRDLIQSTVVFLSCSSYTWVCAFITRWTRKESTLTILLLLLWSFCGYVLSVFFISCPCSLSYYCTSSLSLFLANRQTAGHEISCCWDRESDQREDDVDDDNQEEEKKV